MTTIPYILFGTLILFAVGKLVLMVREARSRSTSGDPLDTVLFHWDSENPCTVRDALNGILILGRTGSGKSSSSLRMIAIAIIRYAKSCGLILAAKVDDIKAWTTIFKLAAREADLVVFSPTEKWRLNCVDWILKSGGRAKDVTRFLMTVGESMRSSDSDGREEGKFWQQQQERLIYTTVTVLWLAYRNVTVPDMQRFINDAAMTPAQIATPQWQNGFHNKSLELAFNAQKTPIEEHDFQLAMAGWLDEFPNMADKTRSSILVGVYGILHTYNSGEARELLSGETNITPRDVLAGKWVLVDMAPAEWGDIGSVVNAAWRYLMQREVLRREAKPDDFVNFIISDECHQTVNTGDSRYLAQSRSHWGSMLFITQSVSSMYDAMGGEKAKHSADALMANFTTTVVHACDPITADWASAKMGRTLQVFMGTSVPPQESMFEDLIGYGRITYSTNEKHEKFLESALLMNGGRTGGKVAGYICDAWVLRSGAPFANGQNCLLVPFSQK